MPDTQTEHAAHGTAAHWIADLTLRGGGLVDKYAGCCVAVYKDGFCEFRHEKNQDHIAEGMMLDEVMLFEVDDEMVNAVQEYVDWCNDLPGEKYPECRVDISRWCPKESQELFVPQEAFEPQMGTSDHAACLPGVLYITDLKYGKGLQVFAKENYQAVLYALGFIDEWDWLYSFKEIHIRICQPRLDHKDVWIITREEIEAVGRYVLERFTLALSKDAPFNPSEKACKFCKGSGKCRAQAEYLSAIRALAFDDLTGPPHFEVPDTRLLTPEEIVEAWNNRKLIITRYDAIERDMIQSMENGVKFPGKKLVESRTHRKWVSEDKALDDLTFAMGIEERKLFKPDSMISPAAAEKMLPKAQRGIVKTLAYTPRGGPAIVDESDPRPEYGSHSSQADAFENIEDPFA